MPVNDRFMLPLRVRTMAQMEDLLQAEQLMLDRLQEAAVELEILGSINNNTTLTRERLEEIVELLSGCTCRVDEYANELTIHIVLIAGSAEPLAIQDKLAPLIPAHLKYLIGTELGAGIHMAASAAGAVLVEGAVAERF